MADNSTHHRVYLPGPLGLGLPRVEDHAGQGCEPADCPIIAAMAAWMAASEDHRYSVQGDYFTLDGLTFERCAYQPRRTP